MTGASQVCVLGDERSPSPLISPSDCCVRLGVSAFQPPVDFVPTNCTAAGRGRPTLMWWDSTTYARTTHPSKHSVRTPLRNPLPGRLTQVANILQGSGQGHCSECFSKYYLHARCGKTGGKALQSTLPPEPCTENTQVLLPKNKGGDRQPTAQFKCGKCQCAEKVREVQTPKNQKRTSEKGF